MTKKLSEVLQAEADDAGGHGETFGREHRSDLEHYAAEARAIEERVAELEGQMREAGSMVIAATERDHAATARAEELEQQRRVLAGQRDAIIDQNNQSVARAEAAETEVARLRVELKNADAAIRFTEDTIEPAFRERDALRAKLEKVAKVCVAAEPENHSGMYDESALARDIIAILDGEGDDET